MDCLFCTMVAGEIPTKRVHEDDVALAFLDIAPWQVGHTLVIPKRHSDNVLEDASILAELAPAIAKVAALLKERLGATAVNILSNAGPDSGQEVFHTHVHVIPRYPDSPGMAAIRSHVTEDVAETHRRIVG